MHSPFKLRNPKWSLVSSLTVIKYSSDEQRLWSDCMYAQAGLSLCWSHIYPGIQFRIPCNPLGQFCMGDKLFIGTPWMRNECVPKTLVLAMWKCMVTMATHSEFENGACLQNYSYLSCYLSQSILNTRFKIRHKPIIHLLHMQIILFAYSWIFMKTIKVWFTKLG